MKYCRNRPRLAGTILLTWQNEAGYLFMLRATDFGDTETLLSMAEGVVPYEGPGVAWEMGWVPEGYEPMYRDEGAGAVQQVWVRDRSCSWPRCRTIWALARGTA